MGSACRETTLVKKGPPLLPLGEYSDGQPSTCSTIPTQSCAVLYDRLSAYERVCPRNCYRNKFCPRKSLSQSISQLQLQAWVLGTCDTTGHTKASSILVFGFQVQVQQLSLPRSEFVFFSFAFINNCKFFLETMPTLWL